VWLFLLHKAKTAERRLVEATKARSDKVQMNSTELYARGSKTAGTKRMQPIRHHHHHHHHHPFVNSSIHPSVHLFVHPLSIIYQESAVKFVKAWESQWPAENGRPEVWQGSAQAQGPLKARSRLQHGVDRPST